ncbi:MAG: hypothetical protein H6574_06880 [Lewinellaceae bacterium]|nr:hypothetical protein [Saprospiraceae bacterium]MCB9330789.1 hypothetical protein [Lewinellaceae bacterium]
MRSLYFLFLLLPLPAFTQAFMRSVDNAAALALGGAVVAYPGTGTGLENDAVPGFANRAAVYAGAAMPFGISSWQTARFQGFARVSARDGFGLDIAHSAIEVYSEQQFRLLYGRRLGEKILLGGSVSILHISAQEYGSTTGATFSLSMLANPLKGLWLGAKIQNPVDLELGGATLPAVLRIGAAWQPASTLTLLLETEKDLERPAQLKAGIEYQPVDQLVLRSGLRTDPARLGFGAGYRLKNGLEIGSGAEWHPTLGFTPSAMIIWRKD